MQKQKAYHEADIASTRVSLKKPETLFLGSIVIASTELYTSVGKLTEIVVDNGEFKYNVEHGAITVQYKRKQLTLVG